MCASVRTIGLSTHLREPGACERTTARRISCPSAKMSALTETASPTVRLDGYRPQSIIGAGDPIWMRGGGGLTFWGAGTPDTLSVSGLS